VTFVAEPAHCRSIYWLNAILVPDAAARDRLLAASHGESLLTRPAWTPMHRLPMYRDCPKAPLPVAEAIADRLVSLPSSAVLAGDRP
jgi:perosamine synthetase